MIFYIVLLISFLVATKADGSGKLLCTGNHFCRNLSDGTVLPDPDDCRYYYLCFLGHDCHRSCPLFQQFDYIRLNCLPFNLAVCYDPSATTTEESTTFTPSVTQEKTTEQITTTELTTGEETTQQITTTTAGQAIICDDGFTGLLPYPNDCTKFYVCYADQEQPTLKDCLQGYIFYVPFGVCLPGNSETCELHHDH
ncbi:uncharacterized protein LOC129729806 [Wyeomyia smithii]|uniref:uncharacterized protein LOC129729806 n=1 Tax=Wyeomyia smithii TaxID=174621 RepID=UPI002467C2F8|nr:uncharacterized protein LOC129729806 [Wyeomyia smithii]